MWYSNVREPVDQMKSGLSNKSEILHVVMDVLVKLTERNT
jgi:hypothetical protein